MQGQPPPQWYAPPAAPGYGPPPAAFDDSPVLVPATWGTRALARIVDTLCGMVCGAIGGGVGGLIIGVMVATHSLPQSAVQNLGKLTAGSIAFSLLGPFAYHAIAETLGGATIGKLAFGLRVMRPEGGPIGFGGAAIRNLAYYIDAFFFGLVAYAVMNGNRLQQRLGDKWGNTTVFRVSSMGGQKQRSAALGIVLGLLAWTLVSFLSAITKAF